MLLCLVLEGFILFGRQFISLWLGEEFISAYPVAVILFSSNLFYLLLEPCQAVLYAKLKNIYRSFILGVVAIIHILLSITFIKMFDYIGAAYATALSTFIGIIVLSVYYNKKLGIDIKRLYTNIFRGLLLTVMVAAIVGVCIMLIPLANTWGVFICRVVLFVIVYIISLYFVGFNWSEKLMVRNILKKVILR